jgi:hypothetical protein
VEVSGLVGGMLQQGVLADAGLAADHQHTAASFARSSEQVSDQRALLTPSIEHRGSRRDQGRREVRVGLGDGSAIDFSSAPGFTRF